MLSFDAVSDELQEFTDVVWWVLEIANQRATAFFAEKDNGEQRRWDPGVHAGLVRYHAISLLDGQGMKAIDEHDKVAFERFDIANNGIYLQHGRFQIRIRKSAPDGKLPPPSSEAQTAFYFQQIPLPGISFTDDWLNLLLLWDIDPVERSLANLVLACPKNTKDKHWGESLTHPALRLLKPSERILVDDDFSEIGLVEQSAIDASE